MAATSNNTYSGYQAWATRLGYLPSYDTKGPWLNTAAVADAQGAIYGIQSKNSGKLYFEFNFRRAVADTDYCFGLSTASHTPTDLPGFSSESWALYTGDIGFFHNSSKTTITETNISDITIATNGYYYDYYSYVKYDGRVVKIAVDFDAGKIWFGIWTGFFDYWEGDPAAGTDPTYTFTPNTSLYPALGWEFKNTGHTCTAMMELGCSRDFARRPPPSGFEFWDSYEHQTEIISDSPVGYWMASPHLYNETSLINSLGYPGLYGDSSVNQKYTEHYNGNAYNNLTADANRIFATAPAYRWYAGANSSFGKYPATIASTSSFTLEASVQITGAGATNGGSDIWTEGSGLVCNYVQANQQASFTLASLWTGISYRGRRFKFGLDTYEVTAGSDVGDGAHHVMAVWDYSASTMTLYVDGAQVGQTTSVSPATKSSSWLAWGALRPNQTNGNFPGYFRDCAFYPSALSSTRVTAHYDALTSTDIDLAGDAAVVQTAAGNLTFPVSLATAASALATAAGNLYMSIALLSSATSQSTATGDLTVPPMAIDLEGAAVAESTATGDMSPYPLESTAQAVATAAGSLASLINLAANSSSTVTVAGNPDILVAIAGAAASLATASAALGQATLLAGDAAAIAQAAANATMQAGMGGAAQGQVTATGEITPVSNLEADAAALATLNGTLSQAMAMAGLAEDIATAAGTLSNVVGLSGTARAETTATGNLSPGEVISGGITYAVNLTTGAVTNWTNAEFERLITAHGRTYALKGGVLYRIGGDVDPGDVQIDSPVRFAQQSFGTNILKTLDKVYVQARSQDGLAVTPIYDEELGLAYTLDADDVASIRPRKIPIGRGNYWFTLGMLIQNQDGGPMDIGGIEMIVNQNLRRVR